jgi:hypothetical protein
MKKLSKLFLLLVCAVSCAHADQRLIVNILGGQPVLSGVCRLLGCNIIRGLDDPLAQVFLLGLPDEIDLTAFLSFLSRTAGVQEIEIDYSVKLKQGPPPIPAALYDSSVAPYFGTSVRGGYINQPAAQIVRLFEAQNAFQVSGRATVAVIDTGVDPHHPALAPVLLDGYDFTRNTEKGSETGDVDQSTAAVIDGSGPAYVAPGTAAVVDQSTANNLNSAKYTDFGHGTMVSGVIHLVAPTALILPLKAFGPDGSGYISDVIRAVYRAARDRADVINMSFSTPQFSSALKRAVDYARQSGSLCVAAAGNDGARISVYPAALNGVIGVASTNNDDVRSDFSNYGSNLVWVTAPGEGIITTFPYGTWAAAWGTSFSTPFVSGTSALLLQARSGLTPGAQGSALSHAKPLNVDLGYGRLDIYRAVQAAVASGF